MKKVFSKQNRALLSELVRTDFKLRYQGSVLGYAWSLLKPLLMFAILYVVFVKFLRIGDAIPNYPIYLLFGIVIWSFFTEMTGQSLSSIVGRGDLIRKIRIPRWLIIVSTSISALINLALNLIVVGVFILISGMDILATSPLVLLILFEVYIFALGVSLILATMFVRYRDVSYLWDVVIQAGFYLTPILYPLSVITNIKVQKLLLLNPMAQAIQDARQVLVTKEAITITDVYGRQYYRLIPLAIVVVVLLCGILYFKKNARTFAEEI